MQFDSRYFGDFGKTSWSGWSGLSLVLTRLSVLLGLVLALLLPTLARADVLVFAAASLVDVAESWAEEFESQNGTVVKIAAAGSSTLARQIAAGAPADLFLSANRAWIDFVVDEAGFQPPKALFGNRLVIIAADTRGAAFSMRDLPEKLGRYRLALGDPSHVPAGQYARQALERAGVWETLAGQLAPAADVRAVLGLVSSGAAPFGIVYATDLRGRNLRLVGRIDSALHDPIVYFGALPADADNEAVAFLNFVAGPEGQRIALEYGFTALGSVDHLSGND